MPMLSRLAHVPLSAASVRAISRWDLCSHHQNWGHNTAGQANYHVPQLAVCLNRALGRNRRMFQSRCLLAAAWTALLWCIICSSSSRMSHRPRLWHRGQIGLRWVAKLGKGTAGECTARGVWGNLDWSLAAGPTTVCSMHGYTSQV